MGQPSRGSIRLIKSTKDTSPVPQPASSTPSSIIKKLSLATNPINSRTSENNSSPLSRKRSRSNRDVKTSPIRRNTLPSPSPERNTTYSSPIKKKRVLFTKDLISDPTTKTEKTPIKPILKSTPLRKSNNNHSQFSVSPSRLDFWSPGNIPRLSTSSNLQDELSNFKSLIHGGSSILEFRNTNKQFEIYATFNLLFKDLTEKKITILSTYLNDILRIIKRDYLDLVDNIQTSNNDPFPIRTLIQIIKNLTSLLSNQRIVSIFWRKNSSNADLARWCITQSCLWLLKPTVSKSLLTANFQLLKEHKVHELIPLQLQEDILYSVINAKQINSSSLTTEKLYTLKTLISNFSLMMEKNVKSWIGSLFSVICDFESPFYLKTLGVTSFVLLESAKTFLNSKAVSFEVSNFCKDSMEKSLNIDVSTYSNSIDSTPFNTKQSVLHFLTTKLLDLLNDPEQTSHLVMDIWLGLALLNHNSELAFNEYLLLIVDKCLRSPDSNTRNLGIKNWKAIIYLTMNEALPQPSKLDTMFSIFQKVEFKDNNPQFPKTFINLFVQLLCSSSHHKSLDQKWIFTSHTQHLLKTYMTNPDLTPYIIHIFNQLLSCKSSNEFYLVNILGNEELAINTIDPLDSSIVLENYLFFKSILVQIWDNETTGARYKTLTLSNFLMKIKSCLQFKTITESPNFWDRFNGIILDIEGFFENVYAAKVKEIEDPIAKLEYFNRFTILMKTNFGKRLFYKFDSNGLEMSFEANNIYFKMILKSLEYNMKATETLRFLIGHNKAFEYKILEKLITDERTSSNEELMSYIVNNLGSKLFDHLSLSELRLVLVVVKSLPFKNEALCLNVLKLLLSSNNLPLFEKLEISSWEASDLLLVLKVIDANSSLKDFKQIAVNQLSRDHETNLHVGFITLLQHIAESDQDSLKVWLYTAFKDSILQYILDSKNYMDHTEFLRIIKFYQQYLEFLKDFDHKTFDEVTSNSLKISTTSDDIEFKIKLKVFEIQRLTYSSLENVNWDEMSQLKQTLDERRNHVGLLDLTKPSTFEVSDSLIVNTIPDGAKSTQIIENSGYVTQSTISSYDIRKELSDEEVQNGVLFTNDQLDTQLEGHQVSTELVIFTAPSDEPVVEGEPVHNNAKNSPVSPNKAANNHTSCLPDTKAKANVELVISDDGSAKLLAPSNVKNGDLQVIDSSLDDHTDDIADQDSSKTLEAEKPERDNVSVELPEDKPDGNVMTTSESSGTKDTQVISDIKLSTIADLNGTKDTQIIPDTAVSVTAESNGTKDTQIIPNEESSPLIPSDSVELTNEEDVSEEVRQSDSKELIDSIENSEETQEVLEDVRQSDSKELIDSIENIEETQEVLDSISQSNEDSEQISSLETIPAKTLVTSSTEIQGTSNEKIDEEESFEDLPLDSSPLQSRSMTPLRSLRSNRQKVVLREVPIPIVSEPEVEDKYETDEDDEDDLVELDDEEYTRSIRQNYERKRNQEDLESPLRKRVCSDYSDQILSTPLNGLTTTPTLLSLYKSKPFDDIIGFLDGLDEAQLGSLSDVEAYKVETKLLSVMIKLRAARSKVAFNGR